MLSDVLYKDNCGQNGSDQPIYCNRIRACKIQILSGKSIVPIADATIETGLSGGQHDQNKVDDDMHPPMPENEAEIDMTVNKVDEPDMG